MAREKALTLIISYKFVRAIGSFLAALAGAALVLLGFSSPIERWVQQLHDQAVSQFALRVTSFILTAVEPKHLWEVIVGIGLDAVLLTVEGWALLRGWKWGVWLVVVASGVLLPWELSALVSHPGLLRAGVLLANLLIVGWLLFHALRKQRGALSERGLRNPGVRVKKAPCACSSPMAAPTPTAPGRC